MRYLIILSIALATWFMVGVLTYQALERYENYLAERARV